MIDGYVEFLELLTTLLRELEETSVQRPDCDLPRGKSPTGWRVADIEMALFAWADQLSKKTRSFSPKANNTFELAG